MCSMSRYKLLFNWVRATAAGGGVARNEEICGISSPALVCPSHQTASIGNACNEDKLSLCCEPLQTSLSSKFSKNSFHLFLTKPSTSYILLVLTNVNSWCTKNVINNLKIICMKMICWKFFLPRRFSHLSKKRHLVEFEGGQSGSICANLEKLIPR